MISANCGPLVPVIKNIQPYTTYPFMLIAELNIIEPIAFGYNSSSVLLSAFYGTINNSGVIMHNPAAFDPDGDRLHFDLLDYRIYPGFCAIHHSARDKLHRH